jgi:hypothetical protein
LCDRGGDYFTDLASCSVIVGGGSGHLTGSDAARIYYAIRIRWRPPESSDEEKDEER